jgi:hypothetical protein
LATFLLHNLLKLLVCSSSHTKVLEPRLTGWGSGWWHRFDGLGADDLRCLLGSVGNLFVAAADGISLIICERDKSNKGTNQLPRALQQ